MGWEHGGGQLSNPSFLLEVARGNVPGMKVFYIPGRKDGLSQVALDDFSQIPATTVIPDPGGIQMEIVSSAAGDTSGSTGVELLDIEYLDTAGNEQTEQMIMNGVNPVNTVATDIDKVQWMHAVQVGSNTVAVGNISLRDTAGVVTYEYIALGGNQSLSCRYHIPTAKTGFIIGWQASAITKIIDVRLRANVDRATRMLQNAFNFQDAEVLDAAPSGWLPFDAPLKCPEGSSIKVSGISAAAGGDGAAMFGVLLIDN